MTVKSMRREITDAHPSCVRDALPIRDIPLVTSFATFEKILFETGLS